MSNYRKDFPILKTEVNGKPLVYFDNAASSQKPQVVIDTISDYYKNYNANVHRGIHHLSEKATELYEGTRRDIARFINAAVPEEIVYTRGTTEAINLVARGWGAQYLNAGDQIVLTVVNHHSNIVPWQMLADERGLEIKWVDCDAKGNLNVEQYIEYLQSGKVKLVALTHISNTLGTIYKIKPLIELAHTAGALVLLDAAQSAPHVKLDVQACDCDFLVFSGHKMCGPTGIGVLYAKKAILESMAPYQGGGDMIMTVEKTGFTTNYVPHKFEAGTPNIAGVVGLKSAIAYLTAVGFDFIRKHEEELTVYALEALSRIPEIALYGPQNVREQIGVVPFTVGTIHPHDVAAHLDTFGVAVRAGNHCTQPLHQALGINASVRASFYLYNTKEEIDVLIAAIKDCIKVYS